jgi:small-conductance mechanosensitive channel
MQEALAKASPDGRANWLLHAVIAGIVSLVAGRLLTKPIANWTRDTFAPRVPANPDSRSQKIAQTLFRGAIFLSMAIISGAIGTLLVVLYAGEHEAFRKTGLAIVWTYAAYRIARSIYINFLLPNVPAYRSINMGDADATSIYRALMVASAISATIIGLCLWMQSLGLDANTHKLALMMGSLSAAIMLAVIAVVYRAPIAQAILGFGEAADEPFWRRTLAKSWHVWVVIYVALAWVVSSMRLLLDQSGAAGLVGAPLIALVVGMAVYGLLLIGIDAFFDRDLPDEQVVSIKEVADEPAEADAAEQDDHDHGPVAVPIRRSVFKGLAEHGAALLISIAGFVYIAKIWDVDLSDNQNWITDSFEIAIVVFIAYISYRAVELWVDAKRQEEGDVESDVRNFLLITIVIIAGMITLSEMGVDIAPLFAGAGVVGLAIGFGAQTLIHDIFSGAFFLIDDAFRKGEYIDIGTAKGTVEKISIRSFQLRHHRGALNTVPFGEIRQLTNYSRDWVMMKLPIRLTYDTDLEKVRKLVKNLGQELLEDPELGPKFLQPLKSQGAAQMEDSAMIVRLKFMTRPGDQFAIRTKVFTLIRELFEKEGIKFAHREVTVRVNETSGGSPDELKAAAAAAAAAGQTEKPV